MLLTPPLRSISRLASPTDLKFQSFIPRLFGISSFLDSLSWAKCTSKEIDILTVFHKPLSVAAAQLGRFCQRSVPCRIGQSLHPRSYGTLARMTRWHHCHSVIHERIELRHWRSYISRGLVLLPELPMKYIWYFLSLSYILCIPGQLSVQSAIKITFLLSCCALFTLYAMAFRSAPKNYTQTEKCILFPKHKRHVLGVVLWCTNKLKLASKVELIRP